MATIECTNCKKQLTSQQAGEECPYCGSKGRNLSPEELDVAQEKSAMARELAMKHFQIEPGLTHIIRCSGSAEIEFTPFEPVKFLEVNANTVASGILPLGFDPAPHSGIPYPSVIVEVTPAEYQKIRARELNLPEGWSIEDEFSKPQELVRVK